MSSEVHLWQIGDSGQLSEVKSSGLDLESRLEDWIARDISILDPALLVIGTQVATDYGGAIDILCVDAEGDLVIVELKRDRTPREVTAQALDYASWVVDLSNDEVTAIAEKHLDDFEGAFAKKFNAELPETLNGDHRILVVGSEIDASSERIMRYLSDTHGVNINAATFQYFPQPEGGHELLARVFVLEPQAGGSGRSGKRRRKLTFEQLHDLAEEANVAELYDHAVTSFRPVLSKRRRTRNSLRLVGSFGDSNNVVIGLIPGESSAEEGLRFQLYKRRFAELANVAVDRLESLMPSQHEVWSEAGEDSGFQGFISSPEEIDELARVLSEGADAPLTD